MKTSICIWKGCKKQVKVDDQFENTKMGQTLGIEVVGWCALHSLAYRKEQELLRKYYPGKEPHEVSNKLFVTDKKRLNEISKEAEKLAGEELKL